MVRVHVHVANGVDEVIGLETARLGRSDGFLVVRTTAVTAAVVHDEKMQMMGYGLACFFTTRCCLMIIIRQCALNDVDFWAKALLFA